MAEISVFLAEGEKHVRKALRLLLETQLGLRVAGEADHAESLLAQVCRQPPNLILLDWDLPGLRPQRLIPILREYCPSTILVATSVKLELEKIAWKWNIDGFLLKQQPPDLFLNALESIMLKLTE
jgi:DNA-binding NarL/FixJ family response regulator